MSNPSAGRLPCRPSVLGALAALAIAASGCTPQYVKEDRTDRRSRELQVVQHAGGTHHVTLVDGNRWVQSFAHRVLLVDVTTGRTLGSVDAVPFGQGGAVVDMVAHGDSVAAVCDRTAVVEIDVSDPADPQVLATITAADLGMEPRLVSMVGDEIYASGEDGVVRLSDRRKFLEGQAAGHVVGTPAGPVTTVGRRIMALEDGRYLGAATDLQPLPAGVGPSGGFAFLLQGSNGASVGLMGPAFTETAHRAVPAFVRRIRVLGDRVFATTDRMIYTWRIDGVQLVEPEEIPLRGGRDIALIRPNHYAVAGSFGRAMYRHRAEDRRDGDTFYNVERAPGLLEVAVTDGRRILAGGREGFWLWRIGSEPELSDRTTDVVTTNDVEVSAAWGSARMIRTKEGATEVCREVEIRHDGTVERYSAADKPAILAIALVDGDLWIGHEDGLDVVRRTDAVMAPAEKGVDADGKPFKPVQLEAARVDAVHRFRFEGPPLFIYPERIGGGAAVVTLHGGFVLVKPVAVGEAPKFEGRGEVK